MNQVNLIGNIGSEPQLSTFPSGKKVMRLSLAHNSYSKDGKARPTLWVDCETWDATADRLIKCSEKGKLSGRRIQITGSLALNDYKRQMGNQEIRVKKIYVKIHQFALLSYAQDAQSQPQELVSEPAGEVMVMSAADESEPADESCQDLVASVFADEPEPAEQPSSPVFSLIAGRSRKPRTK